MILVLNCIQKLFFLDTCDGKVPFCVFRKAAGGFLGAKKIERRSDRMLKIMTALNKVKPGLINY